MPRLPTSLLRKARAIDPLLPRLLGVCRELRAAQNELRWLREYADKIARGRSGKAHRTLLRGMVENRASGKPLQYIVGTEYFGDLEIKCRPGVLIPRQETAASVTHLTHLLRSAQGLPDELRVLDLCTGTGCIPLLFKHEFSDAPHPVRLRLLGIDLSQEALDLAKQNLERLQEPDVDDESSVINFLQADVLKESWDEQTVERPCIQAALNFSRQPQFWDVLISNPPYISPSGYWTTTTRSVRGFEPKLALVPPASEGATDTDQGDTFYPRLLTIASECEAKIILLEVADMKQALRVANLARRLNTCTGIEIWRDQPDQKSGTEHQDGFPVIGTGNARSVLCWRGPGAAWLGKEDELNVMGAATDMPLSLQPQFTYPFVESSEDSRSSYLEDRTMHNHRPRGAYKLFEAGRQLVSQDSKKK
ncbi:S-adenosyl-L-methionine-dependent methyltransferase [Lophiostoma macrostomum CBS 122681]|uniref:S-adenosyl-L-methionine-dependent methyltransferase n=1 Tax=Lophiostoma macrostomum CBS 122681 TaxID=1314788 RepID=A0A6A6SK91_9PLEO|nr:S-adenosyl-L-methionine-dependent methyltransferase [Lophiostoma macrostomum CBS 122681]